MNMQNLMAQAQKVQNDIKKITKELEEKEYVNKTGLVELSMNGKREILKFKINTEDEIDDLEMLEDMIVTAFNGVLKQIDVDKEQKLGKYTGGMGGLF